MVGFCSHTFNRAWTWIFTKSGMKSAGVFPSFPAPRPICSLNCLSDQPSILYRHRIYHYSKWSLLLTLKEKRIFLWYCLSSDKCLQKKSTGHTAEILIPYTRKSLVFVLYGTTPPWPLTPHLETVPLLSPPSWLTATRWLMLPWKFCIFIRVSAFSCENTSIYWENAKSISEG